MINATASDTKAAAENLMAQLGYTFPVYFDAQGEAAMAYEIAAFPTTFFVDAQGKTVTQWVGAMPEAVLNSAIKMILP